MLEVIYNCKLLSVIFAQQRSNYALKHEFSSIVTFLNWPTIPTKPIYYKLKINGLKWMIYTSDCEVFA